MAKASPAKSITVTQVYNLRFDSSKQKDINLNPKWAYQVEKAVNTIEVAIGQALLPPELQALIDSGVAVTIIGMKRG